MNRDAATLQSLLALARTRRQQRALAIAQRLPRQPAPLLRAAMGYVLGASPVGETAPGDAEAEARGDRPAGAAAAATASPGVAPGDAPGAQVLGVDVAAGVAYVVEHRAGDDAPLVYRLHLAGSRRGHLVPHVAWYEACEDAAELRGRIAALARTLAPVARMPAEAFMLSTRVISRRAVRLAPHGPPVRKLALHLEIEPVAGEGPAGGTTVTAFLRPAATLVEVLALPGGAACARVRYTGGPAGLGEPRETVALLTLR